MKKEEAPMNLENEKMIKRFLFDEMSDEKRFEFEERFITDAGLFEEIKVVEDELIEKYVRGWMDSAEGSKFEKHFLTTKKRRMRVELSRKMLEKIVEQEVAVAASVKKNEDVTVARESIWDTLTALLLTPKIAMAGGLALIIGVLGTWVLYQNFNAGNSEVVKENDDTPTTAVTPTPNDTGEIPQNNSENNSVNANIERENNSNVNSQNQTDNMKPKDEKLTKQTPTPKKKDDVEIKETPDPTKTPPIQKTPPNPILALFGGTLRSNGKNNVLNLPKGAKAAILQLNLESLDYKEFQARLTDANGKVVFQRENLKPRKTRVNFNIPAKNLKRGDYVIKLFGKNNAGENESVADFQFRVRQ